MSTTIVHRVRAVLHLEKIRILLLLAGSRTVYASMSAAAGRFPAPVPPLAALLGQINSLETTQQVVSGGSRGAATAARNTARDVLWASLQTEKAYVQSVADGNQPDAVEIIKSSGFDVALPPPPHNKPILDAKLTVISGAVKLTANARALTGGSKKRAAYNWEYSLDGGHTWVPVPGTPTATTTVSGMPLMTNCSFRVSVTLGGVMQPWSQVVTIAVH